MIMGYVFGLLDKCVIIGKVCLMIMIGTLMSGVVCLA